MKLSFKVFVNKKTLPRNIFCYFFTGCVGRGMNELTDCFAERIFVGEGLVVGLFVFHASESLCSRVDNNQTLRHP